VQLGKLVSVTRSVGEIVLSALHNTYDSRIGWSQPRPGYPVLAEIALRVEVDLAKVGMPGRPGTWAACATRLAGTLLVMGPRNLPRRS
jgi:hypothetical protein